MITKCTGPSADTALVTFQVPASTWADSVYLVGDFNDWNRHSHALARSTEDGTWCITVCLPTGRSYQFRYLINGTDWQNDWHADRYVANPFGGENSVVEV